MRPVLAVALLGWLGGRAEGGELELVVVHTNDVHARFEAINGRGGTCLPIDVRTNHCFGGAAKRMTAIRRVRNREPNVLFLNGGDEFQGTIWYTILKWEPIARVLNALGLDVMSFGNHEFDDGLEGLVPFTQALDAPILNANIEAGGSPLEGTFQRSLVKTIAGEEVGIVGYTTAETPEVSHPGPLLRFGDVVRSVREEVQSLRRRGVEKIIAVGHAGYAKDKELCRSVEGLDLVVGGHTNTFLYTGEPPSTELPQGPYPTVLRDTGQPCLVVQDYAFGKYLGHIKLKWDANGVVTEWEGNPILLDKEYPGDPEMEAILAPYLGRLERFKQTVVGATAVGLDGDRTSCRLKECNLGSVLADAAVEAYVPGLGSGAAGKDAVPGHWSPVSIGLWNGGGVRDFSAQAGNLTLEDIYATMPFGNTIESVRLKGSTIRAALEHSVKDYSTEDSHGKFLQVSGLRVVYDLSRGNGERVVSVAARCGDCAIPEYGPLEDERVYGVATISFLMDGGDGFAMLRDEVVSSDHSELLDIDVVQDFLSRHRPLTTGLEGRIAFVDQPLYQTLCSAANARRISLTLLLLLVILGPSV